MRHSSESITPGTAGNHMSRAIRFASKFLLVVLGVVVALRVVWASFAFSRWTGSLALAVTAIILYLTASRWVRWLPGLLIFGIVNSLIGLMTHHAPTNPQVAVSAGVAGLLVTFYTVGCIVSYHYDAAHLSVVDRLALLLYLFCMVWPAFVVNNLASVTPVVAWSTTIGTAALTASFAVHRVRRGKGPFSA